MCFDLSSDRCVNQDPYIQALTLSQWSHVSVVFVFIYNLTIFIYNLTIFIYNLTIFNYFLLPGSHIDSVNAAGQTPLAAAATGVAEIILKSQVCSIQLFIANNRFQVWGSQIERTHWKSNLGIQFQIPSEKTNLTTFILVQDVSEMPGRSVNKEI